MADIFFVVLAVVIVVVEVIGGLVLYARRYVRVPPNMAMIVFGRRREGGQGYKIIRGGGQFIVPIFEDYAFLSLNVRTLTLKINDIIVDIKGKRTKMDFFGVAQAKIASDVVSLETAAEVLLHKSDKDIDDIIQKTFEGHLRDLCSRTPFKDIDEERDKIAKDVTTLVAKDFKNMGLMVMSFVVKDIVEQTGEPSPAKSQISDSSDTTLREILERLTKIEARIDNMEKKLGPGPKD